jgi:DNA adenine methylase
MTTTVRGARPFVKMVGGKTRLLPQIMKRLPEKIGTYVEPFVGGGAVFFALASETPRRFERAVLADANRELIGCYKAIRDDVEAVIRELRLYRYGKRSYLRARSDFNLRGNIVDRVERAACFIYLNRTCFNGLYRVNASGNFNVPFGRYKNPLICNAENLRACSRALQGVSLLGYDFKKVFDFLFAAKRIGRDDFVYFDPPYVPVSKTADFTAYTRGGFTLNHQRALVAIARRLDTKRVGVLLSNADVAAVRALYPTKHFVRRRVSAPRAISCKGSGRGAARELLISPRSSRQKSKAPFRRLATRTPKQPG